MIKEYGAGSKRNKAILSIMYLLDLELHILRFAGFKPREFQLYDESAHSSGSIQRIIYTSTSYSILTLLYDF